MPLVTMCQLLDEAAFSAIDRGIEHGVGKADIDTDGRPAITAGVRELFRDDPGNWDQRGPGKAARRAMKEICAQRMRELGMAGHAGDYEPLTLEQMAERYLPGVRSAAEGVSAPLA